MSNLHRFRLHVPARIAPARIAWLLPLLAACAAEQTTVEQDVPRLVAIGQFEEAVRLAAAEHEADPEDEQALNNYRRATAAWHLEQGRRASFEGLDFEAQDHFLAAREVAPEIWEVDAWLDKTNNSLAERFLTEALDHHIKDDLQGAYEAYESVLEYRPDDRQAKHGLGRVILQLNHRKGMGETYYEDGVRALSDYWLHEAKSRFGYVNKYVPESERTAERTVEVNELLADTRVAIAEGLEREGRHAAASNEYRLALTLDADHSVALEGFERSGIEARASELLSEGDMLILRGRFDEAERVLKEGVEISEVQDDLFEGALVELEQARFKILYDRARGLESDNQFEAAVQAYANLLDKAEYYEDAIARKSTLESFIEDAARLYAQADSAESDDEKRSFLRQIEVFWPDYLDVRERLDALGAGER